MIDQKKSFPLILLAEDDEDDQEFIRFAFEKASQAYNFYIAENGQKALDYLLSQEKLPCLIVLDLNMPVMNGFQTLDAINQKPEFLHIPKIILTTSDLEEDKARCLSKGAVEYLVKPTNMMDIVKTVERMVRYCD